MTDADLRTLHDHLTETAELPVRSDASRRLGEAAAITADIVDDDPPTGVVVDRVQQVSELLAEVEATGDSAADDHVAAAERTARRILADEGD
jgi:hypothetical protein